MEVQTPIAQRHDHAITRQPVKSNVLGRPPESPKPPEPPEGVSARRRRHNPDEAAEPAEPGVLPPPPHNP